jgi:hypothetical protein
MKAAIAKFKSKSSLLTADSKWQNQNRPAPNYLPASNWSLRRHGGG